MPRYDVPKDTLKKVFLEGDAIILSIMEKGGDLLGANSVARACTASVEDGARLFKRSASTTATPPPAQAGDFGGYFSARRFSTPAGTRLPTDAP